MKKELALATLLAAGFATSALGAPLTDYGGITRWPISPGAAPITYFIDPSMGSASTLVTEAFTNWSSSSISTVYISFEAVTTAAAAQIVVESPASLGISGASGVAYPTTNSSGQMTACNADIGASTLTSTYALTTITHEIGHCLGLQHSVVAGAIMSYRSGTSLAPTDDDKYALTLLYPASGSGYPAGCATISDSSRGSGRGPGSRSHGGDGAADPRATEYALFAGAWLAGYLGLRAKSRRV